MAALACYAFVAARLILFWPAGSTPRYYLPMVLPLCVFGGLGYDQLSVRRPQFVAPILVADRPGLLDLRAWATRSPRRCCPSNSARLKVEGAQVTALVEAAPGPIYWSGDVALNLLPYLPGHIQNASLEQLASGTGSSLDDHDHRRRRRLGGAASRQAAHRAGRSASAEQWRLLRLDP